MKTRHHTYSVWLRELLRHPLKPAALLVPTRAVGAVGLVSRSINTITFADWACEAMSRSEEEAM